MSTPRLARGYLGQDDLTAQRFGTVDGVRWFRTGDLVRHERDGQLVFAGRLNDQIKIRGYRVEPGEAEAAVATYPGLAHAVVVAAPGSDGPRLVAYVVPHGTAPDAADLRTHVARLLPDYLRPSAYVVLDRLPLTPNGKLDRAALPAPLAPEPAASYEPPVTARQEALCRIFAEVLGVPRVGLRESFFDLDGQSLLAIRLVSRIQAELGSQLTIGDIFNAPTVHELDALLEAGATAPSR